MNRTLLRKELHQHWQACLLLALLTAGWMTVMRVKIDAGGGSGSAFDGLLALLWTLLPLAGVVLAHRLVALEFRQKTQLFLEALPLPRWRMVALKYVFGFAVITLLVAAALAYNCALAAQAERVTPRFAAILAARSLGWTWCLYSFLFLTGFLGRYRLVLYLALIGGGTLLHNYTDVRLREFGPVALIDPRFPYETTIFPVAALGITAALTAGFVGLSFLMGLMREGTVAGMLGEKMSHREKMFIAGIVMAALGAFTAFDERKAKDPYDLPGAVVEERASVVVKVSLPPGDNTRPAGLLAARAADEVAALAEYLGVATLPPVFIVPRPDFTPGQFERGSLDAAEGVLARANFTAPDFQERAFLTWLVREVVIARNRGRAELERKRWALDGFAALWPERDRAAEPLGGNTVLAERARRTAAKGFEEEELARWFTFEKRVGGDEARAVAWSRLKTLARRHGPDACRDFIRAYLGQPVPRDARATWRDLWHPAPRLLERHAGVSLPAFLVEWREELKASEPPPSP